ncbi:MAG TPA: hypothetical protein VI685_00980 [Candidatus Angelobacter sp.]
MRVLGICIVVCAIGWVVWSRLSQRRNRRRALQVLRWIEAALAGQGHVAGIRWLDASHFKVPLRLTSGLFRRAWIMVEFSPCTMPIHWVLSKLNSRQDQITFEADLDLPPSFSLEVYNFRWFARSSKKTSPGSGDWTFEQTGPFILSTRMEWQKEVTRAMSSITEPCSREFSNIRFQRRSPHFSASMPLETISPTCSSRTCMFDTVLELAANSLPSVF